MFLDSILRTLKIKTDAGATTTEPVVAVGYADISGNATVFTPGEQLSTLNGTTLVTVLNAPANNVQRQIKSINIFNADTVAHTILVYYYNDTTPYEIITIPLQPSTTLLWTYENGWVRQGGATVYTDDDAKAAIAGAVADTAEVNVTYNPSTKIFTWDLIDNSIVIGRLHATATARLFGRSTAGAGGGEEITVGTGLLLSAGSLTCSITQYTDELAQDAIGAMVDASIVYVDATPLLTRAALTGDVTASQGGNATTIANNAVVTAKILDANVTFAKFQNVAGLSVVGRSANSSGVAADITGTDGQVLRVSGTALGFGTIVAAGIASDAVTTAKILNANVTLAKIANAAANSKLLGSGAAGSGAAYSELTLGTGLSMSGTTLNASASGGRTALVADTTYYVRTDGSDSNDGSANDSSHAWLTIQKAINVLLTYDLAGFTATIQVGAGTYTAGISLSSRFVGGTVQLLGDNTTPTNVVISTTSAAAVFLDGAGVNILIKGFQIKTTTGGTGISVTNQATVIANGNMEYGACADGHITADAGGVFKATANYSISGGGLHHVAFRTCGLIDTNGVTVTVKTGTWNFSVAFIWGQRGCGAADMHVMTFTLTGSVTGQRYNIAGNCVVFTNAGGASYFPGNSAGATATGGQYL